MFRRDILASCLALAFVACGTETDSADKEPLSTFTAAELTAVQTGYVGLVHGSYVETAAKAKELQTLIDAFVAKPSEDGLKKAREAWKAAREAYGQTEVYRFYDGPIDNATTGREGQINAWPMDEGYIDYIKGNADSGIINNKKDFPEITAKVLTDANEEGGQNEKSISTGWHAIEFLLWGQDFYVDGPGKRSWKDFITGADATAANGDRRGTFLVVAMKVLVADLNSLVADWTHTGDNYSKSFKAETTKEALRRMLSGMGVLSNGELAGERIDVAMDTKEQEDEHSCFSDNTHRDVVTNAKGIQNVYLGQWGGTKTTGISSLVAKIDPALDTKMKTQLAASVAAAEAIPKPFDTAITSTQGREKLQATIDALRLQSKTIVEVAKALGIANLSVDLPE